MSTSGKSSGSKIELSDLQDWYTTFNTFANSYGTSSMTISMDNTVEPSAADYNKLVNIVSSYRSDDYLSNVTWPTPTNVAADNLLEIAVANNTSTGVVAINNVQKTVKCRNTINYTNGVNSNGTGHDNCSNTMAGSYYNEGHVSLSNTYYNCCQGRYYYCSKSSYTHSNTNKTNGSKIDVTNSNSSY